MNIDLNAKSKVGQSAFHMASRWGCINVVKMIMENSTILNIDLNTKNNAGWTAFHRACNKEVHEVMRNNADIFKIDVTK